MCSLCQRLDYKGDIAALIQAQCNDPGTLETTLVTACECTSPQTQSVLLQHDIFPLILSVLRESHCKTTVQSLLLAVKAWITANKTQTGAPNAQIDHDPRLTLIPILMKVLNKHSDQIIVVKEVVAILTDLLHSIPTASAMSPDIQASKLNEELLLLLKATHFFRTCMKLFASYSLDIDLIVSLCESLTFSFKTFPKSKVVFGDVSKLVLAVITLMVLHKRKETIVLAALSMIRVIGVPDSLLTERNCRRFAKVLQELLGLHGFNQPVIVNHICWLIVSIGTPLANLLEFNISPTRKSSLSVFVNLFMELLAKHASSSETVTHLFWVIANLVIQKVNVAHQFCNAKITIYLSQAMKFFAHLPKVMKYVTFTLKGLTSHVTVLPFLDQEAIYDLIEKLISRYHSNEIVMPPLSAALHNILCFDIQHGQDITKYATLLPYLTNGLTYFHHKLKLQVREDNTVKINTCILDIEESLRCLSYNTTSV
jgi:hypothetical protein